MTPEDLAAMRVWALKYGDERHDELADALEQAWAERNQLAATVVGLEHSSERLVAERNAMQGQVDSADARAERAEAEAERLRAHSVQLNTLCWSIAELVGDVAEDETERPHDFDNTLSQLDRLSGVHAENERLRELRERAERAEAAVERMDAQLGRMRYELHKFDPEWLDIDEDRWHPFEALARVRALGHDSESLVRVEDITAAIEGDHPGDGVQIGSRD